MARTQEVQRVVAVEVAGGIPTPGDAGQGGAGR